MRYDLRLPPTEGIVSINGFENVERVSHHQQSKHHLLFRFGIYIHSRRQRKISRSSQETMPAIIPHGRVADSKQSLSEA
jgi:hypothetical protein